MNTDITLSISNRVKHGPLIGWSYFPRDNKYDYRELNLYLFFIGLHINY
jgi:hypothetical protein